MTESARVSLASWLLERIADDQEWGENFGCNEDHAGLVPNPSCRARVLAECAARRKIIEEHSEDFDRGKCGVCLDYVTDTPGGKPLAVMEPLPCRTLRFLAAPYASEPGYRAEWAV